MDLMNLFDENHLIKSCAPMVRYSKLQFRSLVRKYKCDLCFTPMIMADSFVKSEKARNNEFTTDSNDTPLVVQFAANNGTDLANAAELVAPYSNGVDLNCGCPQRWALKLGIGAQLLNEPEVIQDMVRQVRNRVNNSYSVSVKIRLVADMRRSVDLCQKLESAGVNFLTIHGRTKDQKSDPVNIEALKEITSSLRIPVIANGDIKTIDDAHDIQQSTGCKGVMSARGMLQNPAMFDGYTQTPRACVEDWINLSLSSHLYFITFHHHLVFMLEKVLTKQERRIFNSLATYETVLDFLNDYYQFHFVYMPSSTVISGIWTERPSEGKYFLEKVEQDLGLDDIFFSL